MKEVSSPRIAKYIDDGSITASNFQVPWMAMELGSCNMREEIQTRGKLDIKKLQLVVPQICEAIGHLYEKNFIHRDIKPENFVWKTNDKSQVLMIDFGIAKKLEEDVSSRPLDNFTKTMEFVGPVFFSSPELIAYAANKRHPVDYRSDIFQLGKLIWYMATGIISAGIPSKRDCPINGKSQEIVVQLIHDHPDDRIQTVQEISNMISAL